MYFYAANIRIEIVTNKYILIWLFALLPGMLAGQVMELKGRVTDEENDEPLAFVYITYNGKNRGTLTDIDGYYHLRAEEPIEYLKVAAVGYKTQTIYLDEDHEADDELEIEMEKEPMTLDEVVVSSKANPALVVLNKVIMNREKNNPENLPSYAYKTYNKMHFDVKFTDEQLKNPELIKENPEYFWETIDYIERRHLLLIESITQKFYEKPGQVKENVLSSQVSGFNDPTFTLLSSQLQSFSFYQNDFKVLDNFYINPVSRGSYTTYNFQLKDTVISSDEDTLYVIAFQPKNDEADNTLKGSLTINSNGWAIQSVKAENTKETANKFEITQKYEMVDGKQWFPVEHITNVEFMGVNIDVTQTTGMKESLKPHLTATGKSYIYDIELNPGLDSIAFDHVAMDVQQQATAQDKGYWDEKRRDKLSVKDSSTYAILDSMNRAHNFDLKLRIINSALRGRLPVGPVDIELLKLISFREYEGLRPGLGIVTNDEFSKRFRLSAYVGYGLKDRQVKYGGSGRVFLYRPAELSLFGHYSYDLQEMGGVSFLENESSIKLGELFRGFYMRKFDLVERKRAGVNFRLFSYLEAQADLNFDNTTVTSNYEHWKNGHPVIGGIGPIQYGFGEYALRLRYAYRERYVRSRDKLIAIGTDYPVLRANIIRGDQKLYGDYTYMRYDLCVDYSFNSRGLGLSTMRLTAGLVDGDVPFSRLYNGHALYDEMLSIDALNTFGAMHMGEFMSSRYAYFHFRHNFGAILYKTELSSPELSWVHNIGFGELEHPDSHAGIDFKTMEKGYYETGLIIDNIYIVDKLIGYGAGLYYRYGPYAFANELDNIGWKLSFSLAL